MKTIQITINPELLQLIDKESDGNRSAFFRHAAQLWLKHLSLRKMEQKHKQGYARHPVKIGEFDAWASEQAWPE